jgi:hypothetical protein
MVRLLALMMSSVVLAAGFSSIPYHHDIQEEHSASPPPPTPPMAPPPDSRFVVLGQGYCRLDGGATLGSFNKHCKPKACSDSEVIGGTCVPDDTPEGYDAAWEYCAGLCTETYCSCFALSDGFDMTNDICPYPFEITINGVTKMNGQYRCNTYYQADGQMATVANGAEGFTSYAITSHYPPAPPYSPGMAPCVDVEGWNDADGYGCSTYSYTAYCGLYDQATGPGSCEACCDCVGTSNCV